MRNIYSRVPSGAVHTQHDGCEYVNVPHRLCNKGRTIDENFERPALYRFEGPSFIRNGEAYVYIGRIGDALPDPENVPFGVSIIPA
jgi:hypothetical protein